MRNKLVLSCMLGALCLANPFYAQTLTYQEIKGVDATSDVTVNAGLPSAPPTFRLFGNITGASLFFGSVTAQSLNGQILGGYAGGVYFGTIDPATDSYLILAPAGTYKLTVSYFSASFVSATFNDPVSVIVSGDTQRDINIIPVAPIPTYQVGGTVTGLDSRLPSTSLDFYSDPNGSTGADGSSPVAADGTYQVQLSNGTYTVLSTESNGDSSASSSVVLGTVTVGDGDVAMDFNAPALSNLSGNVLAANLSPLPLNSTVQGFEGLASNLGQVFFSGTGPIDPSGTYQLLLASGHTYTLAVTLPIMPEVLPQSTGYFAFLAPGNTVVNGDAGQDIYVPGAPGTVTISGQVTDPNGAAVAGSVVSAFTQEVAGVSNAYFARNTKTDANGMYQLVVLSGTNYDLVFFAPIFGGTSPSWAKSKTNHLPSDAKQWMRNLRSERSLLPIRGTR